MTYQQILDQGKECLRQAQIPEADLGAWYLFAECFKMDRARFFLCSQEEAPSDQIDRYQSFLRGRLRHIPLEYLIHRTEFMGLSYYVDSRVLIPRQDTECLVEEALLLCKDKDVLDLCTGSGCIGISLAVLGACRSVTLSDASEEALAVARENGLAHSVDVAFVKSDLFEEVDGDFDIIVSNPPYIARKEIQRLMPEVRDYEPVMALDGGEDGLFFYKKIMDQLPGHLRRGGMVLLEIGFEQGKAVSRLLETRAFVRIEVKKDLAGLDRVVCAQYEG